MKNINEVHFEGKIHQNAIVTTREGVRVLIVRDPSDPVLWELPGGRLNLGEEPVEGLRRELREELGIEVEIGPIYHTQFILHQKSGKQNFLIMYIAYIESENIKFAPNADEIAEMQWVDKDSYKNIEMFDDTRESLRVYFEKINK